MSGPLNPALEGNPLSGYLKFAVPSIVALLAISASPVIDGLFIANYLGVESLASVNLIIPVFSLAIGIPYMFSVGGSVMAGKLIGEGNQAGACDIFSKTIIVGLFFSLVFVTCGWLGSEQLFALLGAKPNLFPLMHDYFNTLLWFIPVETLFIIYYYYIRIAGFPALAATAIVIGVVTKIAINFLFFAVLGFGLKGAAIATGIAAIVMLAIMLLHNFSAHNWLKLKLVQTNWKDMAHATYNGFSEFVNEVSSGFVTFVLNLIVIGRLGIEGIAAFSVVSYSLYIGLFYFYGLSEALLAVGSQCYGAKNYERMWSFLKIVTVLLVASAALFSALLLTYGDVFIGFFLDSADTGLMDIARGFITILWPIFIFMGLNVVLAGYLTSVHQPTASLIVAVLRTMLLPLGLLYIIIEFFTEVPFLLAITAGEIIASIVAIFLFMKFKPSKI